MNVLKVLDAVNLEQRIQKTIPLLARQIEGLKLLQRTRANKGTPALRDRQKTLALTNTLKKVNIGDIEDENELDEITDLDQKIKSVQIMIWIGMVILSHSISTIYQHSPRYFSVYQYMYMEYESEQNSKCVIISGLFLISQLEIGIKHLVTSVIKKIVLCKIYANNVTAKCSVSSQLTVQTAIFTLKSLKLHLFS